MNGQVLDGNDFIGRVMVFDKKLLANYSLLHNVEGSILGMFFVGLDTSATDARMTQDTWIKVGVISLLGNSRQWAA